MEEKKSKIGCGGCGANIEVLEYAYSKGVTTMDSGWGYQNEHGFDRILGGFLEKHKDEREKFQIINKLPLFDELYKKRFGWSLGDASDEQLEYGIRDILKEQLEICHTTYFDRYLMHALDDDRHSDNRVLDLDLYKRIIKILIKIKKEGLIKHIGFSAHINFERLYFLVSEFKKEFGDEVDTAEVAYNVLNNTGVDEFHPSRFAQMHGIMVWDSVGEKGIQFLKDNGYYLICMMPLESGRVTQITSAPDWIKWCLRFVMDNKNFDIYLSGTSYTKHLDGFLIAAGEMKDPNPVPDMRIINAGAPSHCHE